MAEERVQSRLAAILAADVVGYSRLMHEDESGTLAQLKTLRKEVFDRRQLCTSCSARVHQFDLSAFLLQTVKTSSFRRSKLPVPIPPPSSGNHTGLAG